jgi:hypothetical protein
MSPPSPANSEPGKRDPIQPHLAAKIVTGVLIGSIAICLMSLFLGCTGNENTRADESSPAKHEHPAPHGGTPVVLGNESYHLEFVLDPVAGKLQAFVLDGEMENFIRSTAPAFKVIATVNGENRPLTFNAVADSATGEKIGDTALFEARADWLKIASQFDALLVSLPIRGTSFEAVKFNFPRGNDRD